VLGVFALIAAFGAWFGSSARATLFRMTVTNIRRSRPIPTNFLGLALEYRSIPVLAGPDRKDVNPVLVQLIRNLDPVGRPVLRIGGQSTDRTWWPVRGMSRPLGITYDLRPSWMTSAKGLAQATNARLIVSVGMEANRPRIDAVEAQQLLKGLGRRYIGAIEVGNEPELYPLIPWYRELHGTPIPWYSHDGTEIFSRRAQYDPQAFAGEFARTLAVMPQVPIAGPDTGVLPWLDEFRQFVSPSSRVRIMTWHAYGLNQCVTDTSSIQYPSVPNLLAPGASRDFVDGISPYVSLAHGVGAALRVDEMNSVTCNGRVGVSNTFASALWAMDALFTVAGLNVDGVNIHTFQDAANGLVDFSRSHGNWVGNVHPVYYGALMFAQAAPPGSTLLRIASGAQDRIRAWATSAPDHRIRALVINDSLTSSALALVRVPAASGPGLIERLRAPSAYATGGVTLGGQRFGANTRTGLLAPPRPQALVPRSGVYRVTLPASSAALVTLGQSHG
jgi:hypothetical protein